MSKSIFSEHNGIQIDVDKFLNSLDYKYAELMFGSHQPTSERGFIEVGMVDGNSVVRFAPFGLQDPNFDFMFGFTPLKHINKETVHNYDLSYDGYCVYDRDTSDITEGQYSWENGSRQWGEYSMKYTLAKTSFRDKDMDFVLSKWNPPFELCKPKQSSVHEYSFGDYIDNHQDIYVDNGKGDGTVITLIQWLNEDKQDRRLVVGKRSAKDMYRLMDTYVNGDTYRTEEDTKPTESEWEKELIVSSNKAVLINNMNHVFYHGVRVNSGGLSYSRIDHIEINKNL